MSVIIVKKGFDLKLEFESVEELTEFYKKYIEPKEEKKKPVPVQKRDLVLQTQKNNKMNTEDLKNILT